MSDTTQKRIVELHEQRKDISQRIARAEQLDNSYEHNDMKLRNLERELERIEIELFEAWRDEHAEKLSMLWSEYLSEMRDSSEHIHYVAQSDACRTEWEQELCDRLKGGAP